MPVSNPQLAHYKLGDKRDLQTQKGRGWFSSVGEKSPPPYRDQNKEKKLFSQPPLPLNAKSISYTDSYMEKDRG